MNELTRFIYENSLGRLVFEYNSPLWVSDISGVSGIDVEIAESRSPTQIGSSITAQNVKPRSFTIDGVIFLGGQPVGGQPQHLQSNLRKQMLDIIAPGVEAKFTCEQLASTLPTTESAAATRESATQTIAESYYLDVVPEKTPEITPGNGVQMFQLRLRAPYPYWKTTAQHKTQIAGLMPLFKFPFFTGGSWYISRFTEDYFTSIENKGNTPIEFTISIIARSEVINPEIFHVQSRKRIFINKTMFVGDEILISTILGKKGITCVSNTGITENGYKYLSYDSDLSMALLPGTNTFRANADTNREGLSVRLDAPEGVRTGV